MVSLKLSGKIIWSTGYEYIKTPDQQNRGQIIFNANGYKWLDGKNGLLTATNIKSSDVNQQWYFNINNNTVMNAGSGKCLELKTSFSEDKASLENCDGNKNSQKLKLIGNLLSYNRLVREGVYEYDQICVDPTAINNRFGTPCPANYESMRLIN